MKLTITTILSILILYNCYTRSDTCERVAKMRIKLWLFAIYTAPEKERPLLELGLFELLRKEKECEEE